MHDITDALEDIQTEHRNLLNIALNKKISKIGSSSSKSAVSLPALPFKRAERFNIELSKGHHEVLKSKGYIDDKGRPTEKYFEEIKNTAKPIKDNLTKKDLYILKNIYLHNEKWEEYIKSKGSISLYERSISLNKSNYFDINGKVIDSIKILLEKENNKLVKSRFSSHHVSLINIIVENKNSINADIYGKYGLKTKWQEQEKKINWMIENNILDKNLKLTNFGKNLRLSKIKPLLIEEINERDLKIIQWIKDGDESKLGLISKKSAYSRLYRFQSSGLIADDFKLTSKLESILKTKSLELKSDVRPAWIKEDRNPRFDDLNEKELNLIKTLALEVPFLSEKQINYRFLIDSVELKNLSQGILNKKKIIVNGKNIDCYALHWNTKEILKPAGIKRALRGRFQKDSHVYHDLMVYESLQHAKEYMLENDQEIHEIIHERSQFQAKISANDNKGMCHADAVVVDKSGGETAVEYGKYSVVRMMQKINGFSQNNVLVYSDSHSMIQNYKSTYNNMTKSNKLKSKNVMFFYLPSVQL